MPRPKTWYAAYPPIGVAEAIATVADLDDGSFLVVVVSTGRAEGRYEVYGRNDRVRGTLAEAQARADAMAITILGRDITGHWHGPREG
jgi:hypothetical protein